MQPLSLLRTNDYEAADHQGVDLLFVLVVPQGETHTHLELLAELAGLFERRKIEQRCVSAKIPSLCLNVFRALKSNIQTLSVHEALYHQRPFRVR